MNNETLNILKYVRPGGGFVPKFPVFGKVEVNGSNEDPLFTYLKVLCYTFEHLILRNDFFCHTCYVSLFTTGIITICEPSYWRYKEILLVPNQSQ